MNTSEDIKKELSSLTEECEDLLNLAQDSKDCLEFGTVYQGWYSRAYKVVQYLAPERLEEFTYYYLIDPKRKSFSSTTYAIQDYIRGVVPSESQWDPYYVVRIRIINQVQILGSLSARIDSVLQDITGHLFAELQDSELTVAAQLKKVNLRAAGAIAGVVLERHLQRATQNHSIPIRKKSPTIADLNDPLKQAEVYSVPMWRKIQLLADIRNLCVHQKDKEPTAEEVDDLISGVNSVIKSVF